MSATTEMSGATAIRSFHGDMPEEALEDLRRRIAAVRLPSKELVQDRSQGVQLATIQGLVRYWTTDYDGRRCEASLNALPHFKTEIDGLDVRFIHVKSRHENALPLIMTHGFPGSVWVEQAYPTLTYFNKVDKGGHFAAWEEPELFATEIRAAFRTLR
jgi:epoxide hydrolase-like protein